MFLPLLWLCFLIDFTRECTADGILYYYSPDMAEPKVCIIELGGTIGDIEGMPFIEAFRQFQFRVGRENFCSVHVSWVPQPNATGNYLKTYVLDFT